MTESSLYERLGGTFAIAAVVDHFSEAVVQNAIVGQQSQNPALREWHTNNLGRLPGLKFMRTLWVCEVAGGPQQYSARTMGDYHRHLMITDQERQAFLEDLQRTFGNFDALTKPSQRIASSRMKAPNLSGLPPLLVIPSPVNWVLRPGESSASLTT